MTAGVIPFSLIRAGLYEAGGRGGMQNSSGLEAGDRGASKAQRTAWPNYQILAAFPVRRVTCPVHVALCRNQAPAKRRQIFLYASLIAFMRSSATCCASKLSFLW